MFCITGTNRVMRAPCWPALSQTKGTRAPSQGHSDRACSSLSSPFRADVKNECSHTSTPSIRLHGVLRDNFNFMIWYIFSCNWVDIRWQQYSSHLRTSSKPNTKNGTYITIKKLKTHNNKILTNLWSVGRAPSLRVIYLHSVWIVLSDWQPMAWSSKYGKKLWELGLL